MILAQCLPDATAAVTILQVPNNRTARITHVYICNSTGSAATASVFVDAESREDQNFDADTAILYAKSVAANSTDAYECGWTLQGGGTIGVTSATANALTFTVFGELL